MKCFQRYECCCHAWHSYNEEFEANAHGVMICRSADPVEKPNRRCCAVMMTHTYLFNAGRQLSKREVSVLGIFVMSTYYQLCFDVCLAIGELVTFSEEVEMMCVNIQTRERNARIVMFFTFARRRGKFDDILSS